MAAQELDKAQVLLDKVPELLDRRKMGGKELPTEAFVRKKSPFNVPSQVPHEPHFLKLHFTERSKQGRAVT